VLPSQVRVCVPQLPHACEAGPAHTCIAHAPQVQLPPQVCVPPEPHACEALGAHTPPPLHAPQSDHVPVLLSHARDCVPQLPHACEAAPEHV
jgi:hypothetical protein